MYAVTCPFSLGVNTTPFSSGTQAMVSGRQVWTLPKSVGSQVLGESPS